MTEASTEFTPFSKIARYSRECVITEKIDGTNAQICIADDGTMRIGSRTRWITPENDNFEFARWCQEHKEELLTLGPGRHFGEWWGGKIQRGYGLQEKRLSLFNVSVWVPHGTAASEKQKELPPCVGVVPVLYRGIFTGSAVDDALAQLRESGSIAAPGWRDPEGIVIFHTASGTLFKKTLIGDEAPKSLLK